MKIPFTKYQVAEARKAIAAGAGADVTLFLSHEHNPWVLLGAFVAGAVLIFNVPNQDAPEAIKLADAFLGDALPQAKPVIDEVAAGAEKVVAAASDDASA